MTTVRTQAELVTELAAKTREITIDSPAGVWLTLTDSGSSSVEARGSSRVVARGSSRVVARGSSRVEAWDSSSVVAGGSSRVEAWGSSSVVARGSSSVEARGSSSVVARDSSSVEAWDSSSVEAGGSSSVVARGSSSVEAWDSSRVEAWDSSRVEAWDSSSVEAWDSSSVEAWGSSRVEAWGSSRVEAWGSSSVEAWDSSSVEAWDSSRVEASKYVAVHLHSQGVRLSGDGHVIDLTALDLSDVTEWCAYHGVKASRGFVTLYKAVDAELRSGRGFSYPIGKTVTDPNWKPGDFCGGGLHLSLSPSCARDYFPDASRFLECRVRVADLCPITGGGAAKAKARAVRVVREVDLHGDPVVSA